MKIGSLPEIKKIEKRIAITPEIAKKYISIGLDVNLPKNFGNHLGINEKEYIDVGVNFLANEKEVTKWLTRKTPKQFKNQDIKRIENEISDRFGDNISISHKQSSKGFNNCKYLNLDELERIIAKLKLLG